MTTVDLRSSSQFIRSSLREANSHLWVTLANSPHSAAEWIPTILQRTTQTGTTHTDTKQLRLSYPPLWFSNNFWSTAHICSFKTQERSDPGHLCTSYSKQHLRITVEVPISGNGGLSYSYQLLCKTAKLLDKTFLFCFVLFDKHFWNNLKREEANRTIWQSWKEKWELERSPPMETILLWGHLPNWEISNLSYNGFEGLKGTKIKIPGPQEVWLLAREPLQSSTGIRTQI